MNGHAGSPYYIGKGHGRRAFTKHSNVPLPNEPHRIVVIYDGLSESQSNLEEKRLIMVYGRIDTGMGCLRNRTDGGEGQCGAKWSSEVIEKRASKMRGRKQRPEVVERLRARFAANRRPPKEKSKKVLSASHRENISAALIGKKKSENHSLSISRAKVGVPRSQDVCEKMRNIMTGKKLSAATKEKMRVSAIAARARRKASASA